jgi:hypothetical protein
MAEVKGRCEGLSYGERSMGSSVMAASPVPRFPLSNGEVLFIA